MYGGIINRLLDYFTQKSYAFQLLIRKVGVFYCQDLCKKEYESQIFQRINERPIEYRFVFNSILKIFPKTVLDVGTGTTALPHLIRTCGPITTATDNIKDYWTRDYFNRHFLVIDDDIIETRLKNRYDLITCVSVLEHIENHKSAFQSMFNLLNPGGHLVLTHPYNEEKYIDNIYKHSDAGYGKDLPFICRIYSRRELNDWLETNNGKIISQEYWRIFSGDLWTFGKRLKPPLQVTNSEQHHLTCILIQKQ